MADSTITGLPAAGTIVGDELLPVDQETGGNTVTSKVTVLNALAGTVGDSTDAAKGDDLVAGKKTDLANAIAFTIHDYNQYRVINLVTDYGADNTGATDVSGLLQDAIDDLPLNTADVGILSPKGFANGGVIFLPRGKYKISTRVTLHRGIRIVGESRESSQLLCFTANGCLYYADAGRYIQDEIVVENLSIWQDASVTATSGALIEVNTGAASVQSVYFKGDNLLLEGGYHCLLLQAGVGCSLSDSNVSRAVSHNVYVPYTGAAATSTTSTVFKNVYSHLSGAGDGFRIERGAYCSFLSCASDSNAGYGYYIDEGSGHSLFACGAESNVTGGVAVVDANGILLNVYVIQNGGATNAIDITNSQKVTLLSGKLTTSTSTGYGVYQVSTSERVTVIGTQFENGFDTNKTNSAFEFLYLTGDGGLVGGIANKWAIGVVQQPDSESTFNVGGDADSDTIYSQKINVSFGAAGALRNAALYAQAITANTAITYPLVIGGFFPAMSKGAASTVTRCAGLYAVQQTAGGTANANLMIDAGSGTVPAGTWSIYNDSTRENLFKGPIRWTSSTGQLDTLGSATPESAVTAPIGSIFRRTDGGYGNAVYVKESGTSTTGWSPIVTNRVSADKGNADATLTVGTSEQTNRWATELTVDRAVTLTTAGAHNGAKFRIVRPAIGAFNLNVGTGPLKALAAGTWCDVEYDGSAWMLTAYGAL